MDPRVSLDQLFGQRGIHVVDVRDTGHRARHRRNERPLHGMDEVVPGRRTIWRHSATITASQITFLNENPARFEPGAAECGNRQSGMLILAFVERQHIHLVPAGAEKLEHRP